MTNTWTNLKALCGEWERRQRYVKVFLAAASKDPVLKIRTMLSDVERKVGSKKIVRAWMLPLTTTCCKVDDRGSSIATPHCKAVCYVPRMAADNENVLITA